MAEGKEKKWYVVRAVSGQENKVKDYIEKEVNHLGMEDYLDQVFLSEFFNYFSWCITNLRKHYGCIAF